MPRQRTGSVFSRGKGKSRTWWARVRFVDEITGALREKVKRAESKAHASELRDQLVREYDTAGQRALETDTKTFAELCDFYKDSYLVEARYHTGRKIAGLRSLQTNLGMLEVLQEHFGHKRLRAIRYEDLRSFRDLRLTTPTRRDIFRHQRTLRTNPNAELRSSRTIATVNRELTLLRRMFNVALEQDWIIKNPFKRGKSLISTADECKRDRILTQDEERRLLAACDEGTLTYSRNGKEVTARCARRKHLKALIIAALDTGCRRGELLKLKWRDVNLEDREITLQALNTKTMRERKVALTTRLFLELESLWQESSKNADELVFGIRDNMRKAFAAACEQAGLSDFRFHDLRHVAASRLVAAHIPLAEVGKVLGHQQPTTTWRYLNANRETIRRAAAALDEFNNQSAMEVREAAEMVN